MLLGMLYLKTMCRSETGELSHIWPETMGKKIGVGPGVCLKNARFARCLFFGVVYLQKQGGEFLVIAVEKSRCKETSSSIWEKYL